MRSCACQRCSCARVPSVNANALCERMCRKHRGGVHAAGTHVSDALRVPVFASQHIHLCRSCILDVHDRSACRQRLTATDTTHLEESAGATKGDIAVCRCVGTPQVKRNAKRVKRLRRPDAGPPLPGSRPGDVRTHFPPFKLRPLPTVLPAPPPAPCRGSPSRPRASGGGP